MVYTDPETIPWTPFLTLYAICAPIFIITSGLFWVRRDKQPVKARSPKFSLLMSAGSFMMLTMLCFRESNKTLFPCIGMFSLFYPLAYLFISSLFFPIQGILILRAFRLYFLLHWQMANFTKKTSWFSSNRNKITNKFLFLIFAGLVIFQIIVTIGIIIVFPQWRDLGALGCRMSGEFMFFGICVLLYIFAGIIAVRLLVESNDRFLIAAELKATLVFWGLLSIPFFAFNMITSLFKYIPYNPFGFSAAYFIIAMLIATQIISIVWPAYESYKDERGWGVHHVEQERLKNLKFEEFEDVLASDIGLRHFSAHLAGEFSSENILFWLDAQHFAKELFVPALQEAEERLNPSASKLKPSRTKSILSKKKHKNSLNEDDDHNSSGVFTRMRSATLSTLGIDNKKKSPSTSPRRSDSNAVTPSKIPPSLVIPDSDRDSQDGPETSNLFLSPTLSLNNPEEDDLMGDSLDEDPDEDYEPLLNRTIPENWWENQAWCKSYLDYEKVRVQRNVARRILEEYLIATVSEKEVNIDDDIRQTCVAELEECGIKPNEAFLGSGVAFFGGPPTTPREEMTGDENGSWFQWLFACFSKKGVNSTNLVELNLLSGIASSDISASGDVEASKIAAELEEAKQFGPINPDIFSRAQNAVFDLMERDSFQRFTKSKHYTRMIEDAERAKERATSLMKANVI